MEYDAKSENLKHNKRVLAYDLQVKQILDNLNKEAAKIVEMTGVEPSLDDIFKFSDFPETNKAIDNLRKKYVSDMKSLIYAGTSSEWNKSNELQDALVNNVFGKLISQVNGEKRERLFQKNQAQLKAFQERMTKGLDLSKNLWNLSGEYQGFLETAISVGLENGTSAIQLSKQLSKYLTNFDKLKSEYTEKFGKAAKVKNCEYASVRLARTEINMAYRTADFLRWKDMPFVLGIEIQLSKSHPEKDICDDLKGEYPANFKFTGWHPNCFCFATPILPTTEQMSDYLNNDMPDGYFDDKSTKQVPDEFTKWVDNNAERMAKSSSLPYFLKDNFNGERIKEYARLKENKEYTDVKFNYSNSGIKATHKRHQFDKDTGKYEKSVQKIGFKHGYSVILGNESSNTFMKKHAAGYWNGIKFEIKTCENITANNLKRGLVHSADKKAPVSVLFIPDRLEFPSDDLINEAIRKYNGEVRKYGKFNVSKLIVMSSNKIKTYSL